MDIAPIDPKELDIAFEEVINKLDKLHQDYAEAAEHFGFMRDSLRQIKPYWVKTAEESFENNFFTPVAASGSTLINTLGEEIKGIENQQKIPQAAIFITANLVDSFLANTSALSNIMEVQGIAEVKYHSNPFMPRENQTAYTERFARLSSALGDTYKQIWETLYGTRADPARGALFLMRQAFDQLFEKLAPNDKVRTSQYWQPKEKERSDLVTREERIHFAAYTCVLDPIKAKSLAEESKLAVEIYNLLNRAHQRDSIDSYKAKKALLSMQRVLENWADALNL